MLESYPDVLTTADTMSILKITKNLMYSLIHNGEIPAVRLGQRKWIIYKHDLIKYLEQLKH